jgi:hypothetical protein
MKELASGTSAAAVVAAVVAVSPQQPEHAEMMRELRGRISAFDESIDLLNELHAQKEKADDLRGIEDERRS